jgi:uncharacterized Zn finger protein
LLEEETTVSATLKTLLAALEKEQLETLLLDLVVGDARLRAVLEQRIADLNRRPAGKAPARPLDLATLRRDVYEVMANSVSPIDAVSARAWEAIKEGAGDQALAILEIATESYARDLEEIDDSDGELGDAFQQLGEVWTTAILAADLSKLERQALARKLERWDKDIAEYGVDEALGPAIEAATQGWDHPWIVGVLQGEREDPPADFAYQRQVGVARVQVLERQGRLEDALHIADAYGLTREYVLLLVKIGRVQEAVDLAMQQIADAATMLDVAGTLWEQGEQEPALQIAEHGLSLEGPRVALAVWLRETAAGMGRNDLALRASLAAYREQRNLEQYLRVAELAGEAWPQHREELLQLARRTPSYIPQGPVDIFLHEGLIDDAIAMVDGGATHTLLERVIDAALPTHPDWVIRTSRRQAESIMDAAKSQYYAAAAQWLARAKTAYRAMGRAAEWDAYLADLLARHGRKRNLVPLLKALK